MDVSHTVERIGPLHSLYVGSGPTGILSPEDRRRILALCGEAFPSFTCMDARGYFRGQAEETLVIQVATDDVARVLNLASEIAADQDQLAVGLASPDANGILIYRRTIPGR
jgi:hypothetical protein